MCCWLSRTYPPFDVILDHVSTYCNYIPMKILRARQPDNIWIILCYVHANDRVLLRIQGAKYVTIRVTRATTSGITSSSDK